MTRIAPLNGNATRPLSEHARERLRDISHKPVPSVELNPGVANRLLREALVETVELPSPFATHKGRLVSHLKITEAGQRVLSGA
ncbi:hypothetical protein [Acidovorax sp. sic0104]|uniref:hypothetical protein n=1 Tax=Acidovorax sp. sic0104 TaxID=2854784 RepID=UPI001C4535D4|nr:hypothetical protein [Acidovorax sp. sic0104]MBV7542231.1 hypothetical protein [Acidovorax sp. sic0104]